MIIDLDDFGANHVISEMCQAHDCRKQLDALHYANPAFKVTLFAIPREMTLELLEWCRANNSWVELAWHGFGHGSNYECATMTYEQFDDQMEANDQWVYDYFVTGFKAPGWQISNDSYLWLLDHGWWVADQAYNNERRPPELPAYVNRNGQFYAHTLAGDSLDLEAWHGHTWDCMGNGIEETFDYVRSQVQAAPGFLFVSEVLR